MKLFCIVPMTGGSPNVDATAYTGYVHCDSIGGFGAYLFSGTPAQMAALNALPQVVGIVAVTESGDVKWAELDGVIASGVRTKLNTWLTARSYPTIPAGWTYRQALEAVYQRLNARFDLNGFDVTE
jgi:hypothetical protein